MRTMNSNFAFKEWSLVCDALGRGDQSLILRKGGIAEGKKGFGFHHDNFFLFPTWFHGQLDKVRASSPLVLSEENRDEVSIGYFVTLDWSGFINSRETLHQLEEFHILHPSVIEERFCYNALKEKEGIHAAFVRVYRLEPSFLLSLEKRFGGCRSWIELPLKEENPALISVLSDEEHFSRKQKFLSIL